ncbi:hypothetical protein ACFE04_002957 [Oxalis oulophora]
MGEGGMIAVYKINLNCKGCEDEVKRAIKGVGSVTSDYTKNKVTVVGNFDPVKVKERLEEKLKKKVEIVSLMPKKPLVLIKKLAAPAPVLALRESTLYLKIRLYTKECKQRINKLIFSFKDVKSVNFYDYEGKDLVRVKGTMDPRALVLFLRNNLTRSVEVFVPPPKKDERKNEKEAPRAGNNKVYIIQNLQIINNFRAR